MPNHNDDSKIMTTANITLSGLYIYPIKSAAGLAIPSATVHPRGLEYDRRWMVVDQAHRFMTQRKFPQMARIQVQLDGETMRISAPNMEPLAVPLQPSPETNNDGDRLTVEVWGDRCPALSMGAESQAWFSHVLGTPCQLVYMPDDTQRPTEHGRHGDQSIVSFADAYPFLLISDASLQDLNDRLPHPIPMNRFRPNLVVSGCDAFAEDKWHQIQLGALTFTVAKACSRCTIPTVDQSTGVRGKEPLKTLATYRHWDGQIWFGQNLMQSESTPTVSGMDGPQLNVGDRLTVLS